MKKLWPCFGRLTRKRSHQSKFEIGFKTSGAFWVQFDDRLPLTDAAGWQGIISKPPGMLYISRNLGANRINPMVKSQEQGHHSSINYWPKTPNNSLSQEGVWYHIAWTFHSHHAGDPEGHFRWYINGEKVLDDNGGVQTLLASSSADFRIGANWSKTANNTKISQMRLYNRILSADEVKLLADTPAGQNISSAELHVEGGMAIEENLSVAGSIHLGDYKTTVNSLFISEPGQLRYKDGDFEGYDGNEWKSLTGINDNQLTTEGIIESTSGGFKLPDGTVIDSADDLGNASNLQDGLGNAVVQVASDGRVGIGTDSPSAELEVVGQIKANSFSADRLSGYSASRNGFAAGIHIQSPNNFLYAADKRFDVSLTNFNNGNAGHLFDDNFEQWGSNNIDANQTAKINIDILPESKPRVVGISHIGATYTRGQIYLSFYSTELPKSVSGRMKVREIVEGENTLDLERNRSGKHPIFRSGLGINNSKLELPTRARTRNYSPRR